VQTLHETLSEPANTSVELRTAAGIEQKSVIAINGDDGNKAVRPAGKPLQITPAVRRGEWLDERSLAKESLGLC
jgi:hypothetical protein